MRVSGAERSSLAITFLCSLFSVERGRVIAIMTGNRSQVGRRRRVRRHFWRFDHISLRRRLFLPQENNYVHVMVGWLGFYVLGRERERERDPSLCTFLTCMQMTLTTETGIIKDGYIILPPPPALCSVTNEFSKSPPPSSQPAIAQEDLAGSSLDNMPVALMRRENNGRKTYY